MDLHKRWRHGFATLFVLLGNGGATTAQTLVVAADVWCPYNCEPEAKQPGYVIELLRAIFSPYGVPVEYRSLPWARALRDAQKGAIGAAIAANQKEVAAYRLVAGKEPIGMAQGCVFVPASSPFRYRSAQDLDRLTRVGVVGGTVYQHDFGDWLRKPENQPKIHAVFGDDTSTRRVEMMGLGRLDAIFEDSAEMGFVLQKKALQTQIVSAGCQKPTALYVAFSPQHPRAQEFASRLDTEIQTMRKTGALRKLLAPYGLKDWKAS